MTALGWTLFFVLYAVGFTHYVVADRVAWRRQGLRWPLRNINRKHLAWPWFMLSETCRALWR